MGVPVKSMVGSTLVFYYADFIMITEPSEACRLPTRSPVNCKSATTSPPVAANRLIALVATQVDTIIDLPITPSNSLAPTDRESV